ncbi:hypothetical protein [Clostridium botulinum]
MESIRGIDIKEKVKRDYISEINLIVITVVLMVLKYLHYIRR